jgi:hypothetical protein
VGEVVSDRPDDDLGLRQPVGQPGSLRRVDGVCVEGDVRRACAAEPAQPLVARADDLVERPFEQVGLVAQDELL